MDISLDGISVPTVFSRDSPAALNESLGIGSIILFVSSVVGVLRAGEVGFYEGLSTKAVVAIYAVWFPDVIIGIRVSFIQRIGEGIT